MAAKTKTTTPSAAAATAAAAAELPTTPTHLPVEARPRWAMRRSRNPPPSSTFFVAMTVVAATALMVTLVSDKIPMASAARYLDEATGTKQQQRQDQGNHRRAVPAGTRAELAGSAAAAAAVAGGGIFSPLPPAAAAAGRHRRRQRQRRLQWSCDLHCANGGLCEYVSGADDVLWKMVQSGAPIQRCVCQVGFAGTGCEIRTSQADSTATTSGTDSCSVAFAVSPFAGAMCRHPYTEYCDGGLRYYYAERAAAAAAAAGDPVAPQGGSKELSFCMNGGKCLSSFLGAQQSPEDFNAGNLLSSVENHGHAGCICPREFYGPRCEFLRYDGGTVVEPISSGTAGSDGRQQENGQQANPGGTTTEGQHQQDEFISSNIGTHSGGGGVLPEIETEGQSIGGAAKGNAMVPPPPSPSSVAGMGENTASSPSENDESVTQTPAYLSIVAGLTGVLISFTAYFAFLKISRIRQQRIGSGGGGGGDKEWRFGRRNIRSQKHSVEKDGTVADNHVDRVTFVAPEDGSITNTNSNTSVDNDAEPREWRCCGDTGSTLQGGLPTFQRRDPYRERHPTENLASSDSRASPPMKSRRKKTARRVAKKKKTCQSPRMAKASATCAPTISFGGDQRTKSTSLDSNGDSEEFVYKNNNECWVVHGDDEDDEELQRLAAANAEQMADKQNSYTTTAGEEEEEEDDIIFEGCYGEDERVIEEETLLIVGDDIKNDGGHADSAAALSLRHYQQSANAFLVMNSSGDAADEERAIMNPIVNEVINISPADGDSPGGLWRSRLHSAVAADESTSSGTLSSPESSRHRLAADEGSASMSDYDDVSSSLPTTSLVSSSSTPSWDTGSEISGFTDAWSDG